MPRRRFTVDTLGADSVASNTTNGTSTTTLIERNLGTVYATTTVGVSGPAVGDFTVYHLTANGVAVTIPPSTATPLGRTLYVVAPGTGCALAPQTVGDILNGSTVVTSLDVSQGAAELMCVKNTVPGWVVVSRYIPTP